MVNGESREIRHGAHDIFEEYLEHYGDEQTAATLALAQIIDARLTSIDKHLSNIVDRLEEKSSSD